MSWFQRYSGDDGQGLFDRLSTIVGESGIVPAVVAASGPVGLRRYVVHAEVKDGRVRVVGLDAPTLPRGGGPPPAAGWAANVGMVEAALAKLRRLLPRGVEFTALALGVVRGADPEPELHFRFDEDAAGFRSAQLPMPVGPPAPTEDPAYLRSLAAWATRVDEVRGRFSVARSEWSLVDGRLDDGQRRLPATALATWHPGQRRFEWLVDEPVGEEAPLVEPEVTVDLAGAIELASYAAARLGAGGVFQGGLDNGMVVFLAVRA